MNFEITISYYDVDPDSFSGRIKKFTHVIACYGENYTHAESIATKWANENIDVDYSIRLIKEIDLSGVYEEDLGPWFICQGEWSEINDHTGKVKNYKMNFLVRAKNSTEASKIAFKEMNDIHYDSRIVNVKETKIEHYIP